ncbi:hypothetical protein Tco_1264794 [Tanacetum coccineum]
MELWPSYTIEVQEALLKSKGCDGTRDQLSSATWRIRQQHYMNASQKLSKDDLTATTATSRRQPAWPC